MIRRYKQSRICFVGTHYALLLYLLHSSYDEIKDTYFIFGEGMDEETANRFEHKTLFRRPEIFKKNDVIGLIFSVFFRIFVLRIIGDKSELYAQDHIGGSKTIIKNHPYILIEDSKYKCSHYRNSDPNFNIYKKLRTTWRYKIKRAIYGCTVYGTNGDNEMCKGVLMSADDPADYLSGKKKYVCDMKECWDVSDDKKKNFILHVFDFKQNEIDSLKRDTILLTQPLYPDALTKDEHIQLYKKVVNNYLQSSLVIKTHPRDVIEYEKLFPETIVFRKKIPSQLLEILGLKYKKQITIFSSAVQNVNYPCSIDWYGTEVSDKLINKYGHCTPPEGANVAKIN